jgi:hypothetical protein
MSTELAARARDVAVEILRTCTGTEPLHELIALGYLQGRIEAAKEIRRETFPPVTRSDYA